MRSSTAIVRTSVNETRPRRHAYSRRYDMLKCPERFRTCDKPLFRVCPKDALICFDTTSRGAAWTWKCCVIDREACLRRGSSDDLRLNVSKDFRTGRRALSPQHEDQSSPTAFAFGMNKCTRRGCFGIAACFWFLPAWPDTSSQQTPSNFMVVAFSVSPLSSCM